MSLQELVRERYEMPQMDVLDGDQRVDCSRAVDGALCSSRHFTTRKTEYEYGNDFLLVCLARFQKHPNGNTTKLRTQVTGICGPLYGTRGEEYRCVAVVYHKGQLQGGHYTATVKQGEETLYCDDGNVQRVADHLNTPAGFDPYILMFKKTGKHKVNSAA